MKKEYPKLGNWIIPNLIKYLFCKHDYVFHRNLYGDESIAANGRSLWYCSKCGKWHVKKELQYKKNEGFGFELWYAQLKNEMCDAMGVSYTISNASDTLKPHYERYYFEDLTPYEAVEEYLSSKI